MIPTTVTNSPPTAAVAMAAPMGQNIMQQQQTQIHSPLLLGIASLILEGRPISDDEYQLTPPRDQNQASTSVDSQHNQSRFDPAHNLSLIGGQSNAADRSFTRSSSSRPRPSVVANTSACNINLTTNPYNFAVSPSSSSSSLQISTGSGSRSGTAYIESISNNYPGSSTASTDSTHQRWTQKLCQLRQISPSAPSMTSEPELVALAINDHLTSAERAGAGDFEIVRRVVLNRANLTSGQTMNSNAHHMNNSSASSSPSSNSDNLLHSLQSLATTCLRWSNPTMAVESSPLIAQKSLQLLMPAGNASKQSTPPPSFHKPGLLDLNMTPGTSHRNKPSATFKKTNSVTSACASVTTKRPKHGPHCDQFLRKMGLAKGETFDAEEHFCDMSYVNITCSRWHAYCHKIEAIIGRKEAVCIEVYLGPVGHKILLEQWILTIKEKVPPPTMTLPSLCSAIRSQLYFSQIVAWCDLLRKSDKSIYDTGRVIYSQTMCPQAGDLATPSSVNTSPSSSPGDVLQAARRPRLNIFYRIKQYDATDCFTSKPNVHNFPNVNVSENCSISVSVKSLPRINGGIPKVAPVSSVTSALNAPSEIDVHISSCSGSTRTFGSEGEGVCVMTPRASATESTLCALGIPIIDHSSPESDDKCNSINGCHDVATCSRSTTKKNCDIKKNNSSCSKYQCYENITESKEWNWFENGCSMESLNTLSHREKQLQKYRKRMLKRDKKRDGKSYCSNDLLDSSYEGNNRINQPMEQGDDLIEYNGNQLRTVMISTGTQTPMTCCQDCGSEKTLICLKCRYSNEEFSPVYSCEMDDGEEEGNENDDLDESSCSLSSCEIITTPRNKAELLLQAIQRTPKNKKKFQQQKLARENSAQLGTSKGSNKKQIKHDHSTTLQQQQNHQQQLQNNNHLPTRVTVTGQKLSPKGVTASCQVCKRQKTQHNFSSVVSSNESATMPRSNMELHTADTAGNGLSMTVMISDENDDEDGGGKGKCAQPNIIDTSPESVNLCCKSTKLTPKIESCSLNSVQNPNETDIRRCHTPPTTIMSKLVNCEAIVQFKTPTTVPTIADGSEPQEEQSQKNIRQHKQIVKPNLLRILCTYSDMNSAVSNGCKDTVSPARLLQSQPPLLMRKTVPKINLTPIFCNSSSSVIESDGLQSAPIPIGSSASSVGGNMAFSFEPAVLTHTQSQSTVAVVVDSNIPVQKSYSAPTLPNSLSLSPRFAKQASFYKRRSRHLSDRSDRSSLGSDEQLSDEEFDYGAAYSPEQSPFKCRTRLAVQFARMPLVGNLEESLFQKRLMPKIEVMGFKVLLGASGGFCPTQLTIPAVAYFYELHGETLSTPYLCEIRLPRKGYFVPRTGTIQVTLLNPMGTVVRMFVIPYDMRDMPPLHRTFIRQRILAEESTPNHTNTNSSSMDASDVNDNKSTPKSPKGESKLGHFISVEQMKRLRYSIHLRFQTSRSGRLSLHTDIRLLISRRTDCDTAAAHAKGVLEAPNELVTDTLMPSEPKYNARPENPNKI